LIVLKPAEPQPSSSSPTGDHVIASDPHQALLLEVAEALTGNDLCLGIATNSPIVMF
jgi:hypothetical protein